MKVSEAIDTRITTRAFLDKPVPAGMLRAILETAKRAPSGGNLQPWRVWVVTGAKLAEFKAIIKERLPSHPRGEGTEYHIYPPDLKEPYKARRYKCGEDMYATINVPREDKVGRLLNFARNFEFFGAPAAIFFAIDRTMQQGQWADLGMFMQSIMLLAREHGLHTCPQEAWAIWHKTLGEFLPVPPELMLFCGMGIGYMDETHPINTLRTERAPLSEFATFLE
ncbi:MAG: nitroreductase [Alphaproteobacteria bacterium]|nr:nitroreductase [Alphaproteobacteria bacterium]